MQTSKFLYLGKKNKNMAEPEYRLIPKGTQIFSINNQTNFITTQDEIIEIKHKGIEGEHIFCELKQLLFNIPGYIPTLIGKGKDEWSLRYSKTEPYSIPDGNF